MRHIGIFGGTFDPPHEGHLGVARAALRSGLVDEVRMMVSPENPFKAGRRMTPARERLRMVELAIDSLPEDERSLIHASGFELSLPTPTYTIDTLHALGTAYPDCHFHLIIGGDNLTAFRRWRGPDEIMRDYGLIIYPRPGDSEWDPTLLPSGCVILEDVPLFPYSSTEVRRVAREEPERLHEMLPGRVAEYVLSHGLYRTESHEHRE